MNARRAREIISVRARSARKNWASKAQKTRDLEVKPPEKALHLSDEKAWRVLRLNPYIEKELLVAYYMTIRS